MVRALAKHVEGLLLRIVSEPRLMTVQLDITNSCNLACAHCYHPHHSNIGALTFPDWEKILESVDQFLTKYRFFPRFMLCGGEPMLSPLLKPLVGILRSRWATAEIMVLSNGTAIKDQTLAALKTGPLTFQISLDGPDAQRHDRVRGKGSFERAVQGIKKLIDSDISVSILTILSHRTAPWIWEHFALAKELKVHSQNFTRLIAEGHGKKLVEDREDWPLAGFDLRDAMTDIMIQAYKSGVATNTDQPLYALIDKSFGQSNLFGYDSIIIDYKGNLKATSRSSYIIGNLKDENLESLFLKNEAFHRVRNRKVEVCGTCNLFDQCGGDRNAAFVEYGKFTAPDPGCWKHLKKGNS